MNESNPDQVDTRSTYYNLTGVPTVWIDGVLPGDSYGGGIGDWDVAGGGYEGGPYGYNQAVLAYAAAQTTPITIDLTHSLNAALDEITITAVVTIQVRRLLPWPVDVSTLCLLKKKLPMKV